MLLRLVTTALIWDLTLLIWVTTLLIWVATLLIWTKTLLKWATTLLKWVMNDITQKIVCEMRAVFLRMNKLSTVKRYLFQKARWMRYNSMNTYSKLTQIQKLFWCLVNITKEVFLILLILILISLFYCQKSNELQMRTRWIFIKRKILQQDFFWTLEDPTTLEFLKMEIIGRQSYLSKIFI